jgi:leader peptidase (prepilin peptidase)/N-methyltransferase
MVAGVICSVLVPGLHWTTSRSTAAWQSLLGLAAGAGIIYFVVRGGKLMFGRKRIALPADTRITFTETSVHFDDKAIPFEELFYRQSDVIALRARTLELVDRCYRDVEVRLSPSRLQIGEEVLNPETVPHMEAVSAQITLPQEAMGFGDVKFMGAIGAFLGWKAVLFSLLASSVIGTFGGLILLFLGRRGLVSLKMPYGPYLAMAAAIWIFWGSDFLGFWNWWLMRASVGNY